MQYRPSDFCSLASEGRHKFHLGRVSHALSVCRTGSCALFLFALVVFLTGEHLGSVFYFTATVTMPSPEEAEDQTKGVGTYTQKKEVVALWESGKFKHKVELRHFLKKE